MKRILIIHPGKANESSSVLQQVDDILGEESDNESEGRGKDKPGNEEDEEQQQPGPAEVKCRESGPQALGLDERTPQPSSEKNILGCVLRWERIHLLTADSLHLGWPGPSQVDQHLNESLHTRLILHLWLIWWLWPNTHTQSVPLCRSQTV